MTSPLLRYGMIVTSSIGIGMVGCYVISLEVWSDSDRVNSLSMAGCDVISLEA